MVVIVLLKNWWWTKIKIRAIDENGNQVGNAVEVNGSNTPRNYNFYCQQYFFKIQKVNVLMYIMVEIFLNHLLILFGIINVKMEKS